jgi:two-component system response regulator HydG
MDCLIKYDWPGNVRELMNAVERGVVLSGSEYIDETDLPMLSGKNSKSKETSRFIVETDKAAEGCLPLEKVEKEAILKTLEAADGNKSEAARRLGITRKTLHKKLKKYGVMS